MEPKTLLEKPADLSHITDLFGSSAPAAPLQMATEDVCLAVALVTAGYADPSLKITGQTSKGALQVDFIFTLSPGETARDVEDRFFAGHFKAEVKSVIGALRTLKKRIARLAKEAPPSGA